MAMNRRDVLKGIGGATAMGSLAGCLGSLGGGGGGGGGGSAAARLWFNRSDSETKTLAENVETFNENQDGSIEQSAIADLNKKLSSALPAGQGPETFGWAHDWIGDFSEKGHLYDASDDIDTDLSSFTEPAQKAIQYDGKLHGLPYAAETVGLIYNKEMVDEPPETISEMKSIMDEHHDPGNGKYGLSYPLNAYFMSGYASAFGGYYYDEENDEVGLSKSETIEGFRLIIEELFPYQPNDPGYDPQAAVFNDGNAPFAINGPWFLGTVADNGIDVGVAPLPKPEGGEPSPYTGVSMWYFSNMMGKNEGRAQSATNWAEWHVTNEDIILDLAKSHGFIPVLKSLQGSDELPANVQGYAESVEMGKPMPTAPHMQAVWGPVESGFTRALNGDQSLEASFKKAEKTIKSNWE